MEKRCQNLTRSLNRTPIAINLLTNPAASTAASLTPPLEINWVSIRQLPPSARLSCKARSADGLITDNLRWHLVRSAERSGFIKILPIFSDALFLAFDPKFFQPKIRGQKLIFILSLKMIAQRISGIVLRPVNHHAFKPVAPKITAAIETNWTN
jgi:hypothetical protein